MKLFSTLLVVAFVGTAGAATALTYNRTGNITPVSDGRICILAGYTMYCN